MEDMHVVLDIPRTRADVVAWWTGFPDDYRAVDPKEQPHRIMVRSRTVDRVELHTFWRFPPLTNMLIPQTLHLTGLPAAFQIDVHLHFLGLLQTNRYALQETAQGTHVRVGFEMTPTNLLGRLLKPLYMVYWRRSAPVSYGRAALLCARDAPRQTQV